MSPNMPSPAASADAGYPQSDAWEPTQEMTQHSIMLIDDSLAVRRIIEASFGRIGITAATFPDGLSAIHALAKGEATVPDVLLLDIGLPKMDGYEVARILRTNAAFEQTIIIMLTGRDGMIDRIRSKMVGARDYIKKPFRVSQVVNTVCGHLRIPIPVAGEPVAPRPGGPLGM